MRELNWTGLIRFPGNFSCPTTVKLWSGLWIRILIRVLGRIRIRFSKYGQIRSEHQVKKFSNFSFLGLPLEDQARYISFLEKKPVNPNNIRGGGSLASQRIVNGCFFTEITLLKKISDLYFTK